MRMYKVVRHDNGNFYSCCMYSSTLRYVIGRKTIPDYGKVFVFKRLEDARSYAPNNPVFVGEGENPHRIFLASSLESFDKKFWELKRMKKKIGHLAIHVPNRSYVVDSFVPLKLQE